MRTDFREERKWKLALAFHLGTAVLEWHAAGSLEERVRRKICVLWKPPRKEETEIEEGIDESELMDVDDNAAVPSIPTPMVDYNSSGDEEDEPEPEQKDVIDALDTSAAVLDALDGVEASASAEIDRRQEGVKPKIEEADDRSALSRNTSIGKDDSMDIDGLTTQNMSSKSHAEENTSKTEEDSSAVLPSGLKPTSSDPILTANSHSEAVSTDTSGSGSKIAPKPNLYAPLRERIARSSAEKLFLDLDDYDELVKDLAALSTGKDVLEPPPPPPHDLSAIFPDLQPFGLLNIPIPPVISTEGKKKSDRKSDKDDPTKRVEDTTYTKLVPLGEFMYCKPTLLGPLNPAKRWKQGKWINSEEVVSNIENDSSAPSESLCGQPCFQFYSVRIHLFIHYLCYITDLFGGTKPASVLERVLAPREPKDARRRTADQLWTSNDDLLLKSLAERYPNNWPLIADAFNSSRVTISIDRRIPWDCFERWCVRWGGGSSLTRDHLEMSSPAFLEGMTPPPAVPARDQMTTRGVKRLASVSVGGNASPGGSGNEPKKRRRHNLMFDAIRKAAKKRDQNQKTSGKITLIRK